MPREVKLLASFTQLGGGRGWIQTQLVSALLSGTAWNLLAVSMRVEENIGSEDQGCMGRAFCLDATPATGLEWWGFLFLTP